jgi:hypothetical protein
LLDRVTRNQSAVVTPSVDVIDHNTFEYRSVNTASEMTTRFLWTLTVICSLIGSMDWMGYTSYFLHIMLKMLFQAQWRQVEGRAILQSQEEPRPIPVLGHGIFSVHRNFLESLEWLDTEGELIGGESMELSFKVLLFAPSSANPSTLK